MLLCNKVSLTKKLSPFLNIGVPILKVGVSIEYLKALSLSALV